MSFFCLIISIRSVCESRLFAFAGFTEVWGYARLAHLYLVDIIPREDKDDDLTADESL